MVKSLATERGVPWPNDCRAGPPQARLNVCHGSDGILPIDVKSMIQSAKYVRHFKDTSRVYVVENIQPDWIEALGTAWGIVPDFFVEHASNPPEYVVREGEWERLLECSCFVDGDPEEDRLPTYCSMTGIFEHSFEADARKIEEWTEHDVNFFPRHRTRGPNGTYNKAEQFSTKMSYIRVNTGVYLVLVDKESWTLNASQDAKLSLTGPRLRLPYSSEISGILIPDPRQNGTEGPQPWPARSAYSLVKAFGDLLKDPTFLRMLYLEEKACLHPEFLLHYLSCSLSRGALRCVDGQIKHVSFRQLREPTMEINNRLHDLRELLALLREDCEQDTRLELETTLRRCFSEATYGGAKHLHSRMYPPADFQRDAEVLNRLLMDTFQLLMSSLSVKDSQISIQQSRRGMLITVLAFIYVPLSFVTGIFGMNVKEINGSPISVSVCFEALAIVVAATAVGFVFYATVRYVRRVYFRHKPGSLSGFEILGLVVALFPIIVTASEVWMSRMIPWSQGRKVKRQSDTELGLRSHSPPPQVNSLS